MKCYQTLKKGANTINLVKKECNKEGMILDSEIFLIFSEEGLANANKKGPKALSLK